MWEVDEDAYWERRREEYESRMYGDPNEPVLVEDVLWVDDEEREEEIEARCGYTPQEIHDGTLAEGDLMEIVLEMVGIEAESARYDGRMQGIYYKYYDKTA